jgi:hypothetical protein
VKVLVNTTRSLFKSVIETFGRPMSPWLSLSISSLTLPDMQERGGCVGAADDVGTALVVGWELGEEDSVGAGDAEGAEEGNLSTKSFPVEISPGPRGTRI